MAFSLYKILKGLLITEENTLTPKEVEVLPGGTAGTKTTIQASQTTNKTLTLPDATDTLVGKNTTDTLTNKTLDTAGSNTLKVNGNTLAASAGTATVTIPNSTDTLVGRATTDTLTNKTLTTPVISQISNTGTLTLPTSTDTLVGRNTTDTLTNKTLTSPVISSISNTGTLTLPTSTDTLVGRATTDTLTNKTLTSPSLTTPSTDVVTLDGQASTPSTPSSGFYKAYVKDSTQKLTILDSAGVETTVGSGTGVNNYITANDGTTIGDWVTYADAAAASPVDGTGGSPSSTFAVSTSSTMRGTTNFLFTHSAANRQGEGFSYTMAIDPSDRGKVLRLSFDYLVASGTYADDDLLVYFYDVTNAALIQPAPYKIKNSSLIERFSSEVQIPSSCASLRVIFHVATSTATAYTMRFDDFFFGQQAKLYGSPITDWVSYTPTGSWSNTTYTGKWRRVGDSMEIQAFLKLTGAPSGSLTLNMPSGYTIDTAKINSSDIGSNLGYISVRDFGISTRVGIAQYYSTTGFLFYTADSAGDNSVTATQPFTFASTDEISINIRVPILGWSSSVVMSSDADTRVISAVYNTNSVNTVANNSETILDFEDKVKDSHNAVTTGAAWKFTVPSPGDYHISANFNVSFASSLDAGEQYSVRIYKNGSAVAIWYLNSSVAANGSYPTQISRIIPDLIAGDYLDIRVYQNSGGNMTLYTTYGYSNGISIYKLSGPTQIAASETIAASYSGGAGDSLSGTAILFKCTTKNYDTHGIYNSSTGVITFPISGKYVISGNFLVGNQATANNQSIRTDIRSSSTADSGGTLIYRNLAYFMNGQNPTTINFKSPIINANAGDVYAVNIASDLAASRTLDSNTFTSNISIVRVGN